MNYNRAAFHYRKLASVPWQDNATGYFPTLESHGFLAFYQQAGTKENKKKCCKQQENLSHSVIAYWHEISSLDVKGTNLKTQELDHEKGVPVITPE